jgi:dolichyl-diphosphooligosaccharide--protein glycosyltransferase
MTIHIREVCVFLAPLFSGLAAVATYLLTAELKDDGAGLLAAAFIGIGMGRPWPASCFSIASFGSVQWKMI